MSQVESIDSMVAPATAAPSEVSSVSSVQHIYSVVLAVGFCCGLAIVCVFEITKPIIARNQIAMRESAIVEVITGSTTTVGYVYDKSTDQFRQTDGEADLFAGFDESGKLVGFAIETSGMGYQDNIRILYGYDPETETVVGIKVLESRETPGLGDRVEKDAKFLANFDALDVAVAGDALAHPIEFVKSGRKDQSWQIDGITGATISSRATATMLHDSTNLWMPRIQACKSQFLPKDR